MKEPGLDNRHRDENAPKAGEIQQKRTDTLDKNLPKPIPQFSPNAKLATTCAYSLREKTNLDSGLPTQAKEMTNLQHAPIAL